MKKMKHIRMIMTWAALIAAATAGLGVAYLPDCLTHEHVVAGALVPIMTRYPPPPAGAYVIRPPGQHPARKIRVLTDLLIEHFGQSPHFAGQGKPTLALPPSPRLSSWPLQAWPCRRRSEPAD